MILLIQRCGYAPSGEYELPPNPEVQDIQGRIERRAGLVEWVEHRARLVFG
jgi:hypothetical protein